MNQKNKPASKLDDKWQDQGRENPARCRSCIHRDIVSINGGTELYTACCYCVDTGSHRPCPAGYGCTVYEEGPQIKRQWLAYL